MTSLKADSQKAFCHMTMCICVASVFILLVRLGLLSMSFVVFVVVNDDIVALADFYFFIFLIFLLLLLVIFVVVVDLLLFSLSGYHFLEDLCFFS